MPKKLNLMILGICEHRLVLNITLIIRDAINNNLPMAITISNKTCPKTEFDKENQISEMLSSLVISINLQRDLYESRVHITGSHLWPCDNVDYPQVGQRIANYTTVNGFFSLSYKTERRLFTIPLTPFNTQFQRYG